jgi:hypothetical protein
MTTDNLHGYTQAYIRSHADKKEAFIRKMSFKAFAVDRRAKN